MISTAPHLGVPRGLERGLLWTIALSAIAHCAVLALLVAMPGHFLSAPPRIESYTVDLVAPDVVGGTNLSRGGGRSAEAVPPARPPALPPEPRVSREPAVAQPPPVVAPQVDKAPKPELVNNPAPHVQPEEKVAKPKPVEAKAPDPKPVPPKAAEPPRVPAPKAEAKPVAKEPSAPAQVEPKVAAKPVAVPQPPGKAAAQPVPLAAAKPAVAADKKPAAPAAASAADKERAAAPSSAGNAAPAVEPRDQAIAAAIERRAAQVKATDASKDADQRIAAAVQHRVAQVEKGGGIAGTAVGGPVSSGPGSGAGGTAADLQYVLYHGRMIERIKAAWAWAGADKSLRVVIQFNIGADGEIKNVRVLESSRDPQYDVSAERAVRAVSPLDPVPEKYREAFSTQEITFQASDLES